MTEKRKKEHNLIYDYLIENNYPEIEKYRVAFYRVFHNDKLKSDSDYYYMICLYLKEEDINNRKKELHVAIPKTVIKIPKEIKIEKFVYLGYYDENDNYYE